MDIRNATDLQVVAAINSDSIASEDLVSREGWKRICQVRGRNIAAVRDVAWQDLCARRGYLLRRGNSRGY